MKSEKFDRRSLLYALYSLAILVIVLGIMSGCLYRHNRNYIKQNRDLVIKNDSIMSVNIELADAIHTKGPTLPAGKSSIKKHP